MIYLAAIRGQEEGSDNFQRLARGLRMIMGYPYPRLGVRKEDPIIPNDWPAIDGRS